MTRDQAIQHISSLYPPDSEYKDTAEIGKQLLDKAKSEVHFIPWWDESDQVLIRFAELSIDKESRT